MRTGLSVIVFLLYLSPWSLAQQNAPSQVQVRQTLPEEITIIGERSLFELRTRMWEAEQNAYDIFNKFNDERRFHISCRMHQPTGTRFRFQDCQPGFQLEATRAQAMNFMANVSGMMGNGSPPVEAVIAAETPEYQNKMRQIAEEHPEFLEAILQYNELRERYEGATSMGRSEE